MATTLDLERLVTKLNPTSRTALEEAASLCVSQAHYNVEVEHILAKLLEQDADTDVHRILRAVDVAPADVEQELKSAMEAFKRGNSRTPSMSPHVVTLLREAWMMASMEYDFSTVRSGFLLRALLETDSLLGVVADRLPSLLNVPRGRLQEVVDAVVTQTEEGERRSAPEAAGDGAEAPTSTPDPSSATGESEALDQYTTDMTAQARAGAIDPIRGRDSEIRQVADILMRRRQNNPILTGKAGVGKTAVVEGFAQRIADGNVPPALEKISVRQLDLGLLQAGASMQGEFENRLKSVIREVKASPTPVVLFIDEVHTIIGAGGKAGQGDAANLLKPALARGELRTIAATTQAEYKKYFEKDAALARRFQNIQVQEPSQEVAVDMLRGVAEVLQDHHGVRILDEAIQGAVALSDRYITGRNLPDKAITVLDTAGARVAIGQSSVPPALEDVRHHIDKIKLEVKRLKSEAFANDQDHKERLDLLQEELDDLTAREDALEEQWEQERELVTDIRKMERTLTAHASSNGEAPADAEDNAEDNAAQTDADADRQADLSTVQADLDAKRAALADLQAEDALVPVAVDVQAVAQVISGWTGIPMGEMETDEIKDVLSLQDRLAERVIGQDHALESIARRIRTSRASLEDPNKPVGVFLLAGPSGVGKTETAQALSDALYGGHIVRINLSEYQEAHTVSKLKGSPPGYVGHGEGGVLTEAVRHAPYSVVLLDEIEKAHPDVLELFYQVFDKGELEDSDGITVDFRNTIIILTSNVGTDTIMRMTDRGQTRPDTEVLDDALRDVLHDHFPAAFLGRMVSVPYYPLGEEQLSTIVDLKLRRVQKRFEQNHNAALTYSDAVRDQITQRCQTVESGARNIDYILTHTLLPALSTQLLSRMAEGDPIGATHVDVDAAGAFTYEVTA